MDVETFLQCVASEPEVEIRVAPLKLDSIPPGGILLVDLLKWTERGPPEPFRYRHVVGPGASREAITKWNDEHPQLPLSASLIELLRRIDGIHLWADERSCLSSQGILPLCEWTPLVARVGVEERERVRHCVEMGYHIDGEYLIAADLRSGIFYMVDVDGFDLNCPIASNVEELLDWLWMRRINPKQSSSTE